MNILVLRFSAMGDVALTVPVIKGLVKQNPGINVTMVTRRSFAPFFNTIPEIELFHPNFGLRHKGFWGIIRIFRDLRRRKKFDYVIDLHDVIRTRLLVHLFRNNGIPSAVIDKGRIEKKNLISGKGKKQLEHTVIRYCDTFSRAGIKISPEKCFCFFPKDETLIKVSTFFLFGGEDLNIGIAPYAKHQLKMWPEEYMVKLLRMIGDRRKAKFWLFGSYDELRGLNAFNEKFPGAFMVAGKFKLEEELAIMGKLDFMIAMDSSNMHMASLAGTKVVSIWGGTDPMAGFSAWQQPEEYSLRIPIKDLECRPCTIYGKGKCKREDLACMYWLKPEMVFDKLIGLDLI